jgi:hypothetical protein
MNTTLKKNNLSPARQELLALMQSTHFGKIKNLSVKDGQPILVPPPRIVRKIKLAAANKCRTAGPGDFTLKKETTEFFAQLDRLGTGVVKCIEVKNGLPFSMDIETEGQR